MKKSNENRFYIDKQDLYAEFVRYDKLKKEWTASGKEGYPPITSKMGEAALLISEKMATTYSFAVLPYNEELIDEAVLACVTYMNRFDVEKSDNPFAYTTSIVRNAFLHCIAKHKKQQEIKDALLEQETIGAAFAGFNETGGTIGSQKHLDTLMKYKDERASFNREFDKASSK